jgi:hypothetical protein
MTPAIHGPEHNYLKKLRAMIATGALPCDVGLHRLTVAHDDWCGVFQQQRCNCDPDIRLRWSQPGAARN